MGLVILVPFPAPLELVLPFLFFVESSVSSFIFLLHFLFLFPGRNRSFFGTGESFLFTVSPERRKFDWVGTKLGAEISLDASLFVAADDTTLIIGA